VVCYPRSITNAMLVHASRMANRSLSSFMILASLKQAAAIKGVHVEDLVPQDELEQYLRVKGYAHSRMDKRMEAQAKMIEAMGLNEETAQRLIP
jgi:hypothetical protein